MGGLGRFLLKQEHVRIEGGIFGQAIEGMFEASVEIRKALLQGEQDAHEDFAGFGGGDRAL